MDMQDEPVAKISDLSFEASAAILGPILRDIDDAAGMAPGNDSAYRKRVERLIPDALSLFQNMQALTSDLRAELVEKLRPLAEEAARELAEPDDEDLAEDEDGSIEEMGRADPAKVLEIMREMLSIMREEPAGAEPVDHEGEPIPVRVAGQPAVAKPYSEAIEVAKILQRVGQPAVPGDRTAPAGHTWQAEMLEEVRGMCLQMERHHGESLKENQYRAEIQTKILEELQHTHQDQLAHWREEDGRRGE